ncbi:MAG: hypothetical protein L7R83_02385, partial [Candidatus Poseidonia sp.]|nr:hypothetical protein [Poseidonia sp.]
MSTLHRTTPGLLVTLLLVTALAPIASVQAVPDEASEYYYGVEYDWSSLDSDLENVTGLDVQALFTEIMADADAAGFNLDIGQLTTGASNVYVHQTEDITPQTIQDLDGNDVQVWSRTSDVVLRHGLLSNAVIMTDWSETTFGSEPTSFDIDVIATAENVLMVDIAYTEFLNDAYELVGADMDIAMTVGADLDLGIDVMLEGGGEDLTVDFNTGIDFAYTIASDDAEWRLGQASPIYVEAAANDQTEWECVDDAMNVGTEDIWGTTYVYDECGSLSGTFAGTADYELVFTGLPTEEFGLDAGEFDLSVSDSLSENGTYEADAQMDGVAFSMRTDEPLEVDLGGGTMLDVVACDSCPPGNPVMFLMMGNVLGQASIAFGESIAETLEANLEDSFLGIFEAWAGSLAEGNTDGDLSVYAFSGEDAWGATGTGTDDDLIYLTMDQGSDINWAAVSVRVSVDGGAPMTCDNPGVDGTSPCSLVEFGNTDDQVWSAGDGVTIFENGQDLCSSSCSIDVTILDTLENKIIDEVSAYTEGGAGRAESSDDDNDDEVMPSERLETITTALAESGLMNVLTGFGENLEDTLRTFEQDTETPEFPYVDGMWAPLWSNEHATIVGVGVYAWDEDGNAYVIAGPETVGYSQDLPMTFASIRYITGVP